MNPLGFLQTNAGRQFIRFLVVGGAGTALNIAIFALCLYALHINHKAASVLAFLVAVSSNYYWNRVWTFRSAGRPGADVQFGEFFTASLLGFGVNFIVLILLADGLGWPPVIGQLAGIAAGTLVNFATSKFWVFAENRRQSGAFALRYLGVLCGVVIVAVLLRVQDISKESLWIDEAWAVHLSSGPFSDALHAEATNPPLYYVMLHFWIKLFGTSEAAVRALSVVPSVAAVVLTYLLGTRLYRERVGLIAAGFMAVSTFQLQFAQETRCFALLLALLLGSALSMEIMLDPNRAKSRIGPGLAYLLTTAAALYTHYYAVLFVVAQNLFFVLRWRENRPRLLAWIGAQLALVLLFAPWLPTMLAAAGGSAQPRRYLLLKVPQAFFCFLAGETLVPMDEAAVQNIRSTLAGGWYWLLASALAFGFILLLACLAAPRRWRTTAFLAALTLGPALLAFALSLKTRSLDRRYLIGVTPALALFLASGLEFALERLPDGRPKPVRRLGLIAAALVLILTAVALHNYYFSPRYGKEQWREVAAYIEAAAQPSDIAVFHPGYIQVSYDYYARRQDVVRLRLKDAVEDESSDAWRKEALPEIQRHDRIWFVQSHAPDDAVLNRILREFRQTDVKRFPKAKGVDVYRLEGK